MLLEIVAVFINFLTLCNAVSVDSFPLCKVTIDSDQFRGSVFSVIIILFAGGWSDRYNIRKPLLYFPFIGEILSFTVLLMSSIFMDTLPSVYPIVVANVLSNMFGGVSLFFLGAFTYMTVTTKEEDRTFRLGVFGIVANALTFAVSFSGVFAQLGYRDGHIVALVILFAGLLHVIFFIPEPKDAGKTSQSEFATDNPAFENTELPELPPPATRRTQIENPIDGVVQETAPKVEAVKKSKCAEIFDITLLIDSFSVIIKKRSIRYVHFLIILLIFTYWFVGAPSSGESDYVFKYTQLQLKWDGIIYAAYTESTLVFKISDPLIGFIASITTILSRLFFAFAKTTTTYYIGGALTLFESMRVIPIKSISSTLVEPDEIGRLFSLMSLLDSFGGFFFPPLYSKVFISTVDTFPGAFYILSQVFFIPVTIAFIVTYILLKMIKKQKKKADQEVKADTFRRIEQTYL
uniref:Major facilitator superfamily (MFS) profile domain-containing protein n=1 Tax=Megaselia scalaris TaxID=36166 RepID=T1GHM7_MEGSC